MRKTEWETGMAVIGIVFGVLCVILVLAMGFGVIQLIRHLFQG